jgi:hypothetical protein
MSNETPKYINYEEDGMGVYSNKPGQKSRVVGGTQSKAGAGRGGQGGPTAKELRDYERKQDRGIYTAEMGQPPMDPEGKKKGGMVSASSRADGIASRGKTRGKMV